MIQNSIMKLRRYRNKFDYDSITCDSRILKDLHGNFIKIKDKIRWIL